MNVSQHTTCKMIITFNVKFISGYHIEVLVGAVSTGNSKMESSPCPGELNSRTTSHQFFKSIIICHSDCVCTASEIDGFLRLTIKDTCCHAVAM